MIGYLPITPINPLLLDPVPRCAQRMLAMDYQSGQPLGPLGTTVLLLSATADRKQLLLTVAIQNRGARIAIVPPLDRFRLYFEYRLPAIKGTRGMRSQEIDPFRSGSYPFSKALGDEEIVRLGPSNTLSATFLAKLEKPLPRAVQVRAIIHEFMGERNGLMIWYDRESPWCPIGRR